MKKMKDVFGVDKPIIAMLHMTGWGPEEKMKIAKEEIDIFYRSGVTAVLVENYFGGAEDVEMALAYLQKTYPDKIYGVNMLGDPRRAFDLARKYGAKFVQIDSVCGHLKPNADEKYAAELAALRGEGDIFLLGGVRFKYTVHRSGRSLQEDLQLGMQRCDAIVVTGEGTGIATDLEKIRSFRTYLGDFPLVVGAGMTAATARQQLQLADGAIVGTDFKEGGRTEYPVDENRVRVFMTQVRLARN